MVFDITEKLSHCKHPVEVRDRPAGEARSKKKRPLQSRKTSLYTSAQTSERTERGKGKGWRGGMFGRER